MPRKSTKGTSAPSNKRPTAAEMEQWYSLNKEKLQRYEEDDKLFKKLRDFTKANLSKIKTFDKDNLKSYLQNISSHEKDIRSLSQFLYNRSMAYKRWIIYNANMFDLTARQVIPKYNLSKGNNDKKMLKSFNDTCDILDRQELQGEMYHILVDCFIQDIFYGCKYADETGLFILPIPPDACKLVGRYIESKDFAFAVDMTQFTSHPELIEIWGEPFISMFKAYQSDMVNGRYQMMPDEYSCCFKYSVEDTENILPPGLPLFNAIISLADLENIQAIADQQEIFKMIYMKIPRIDGTKQIDDQAVNMDLVLKYYDKMVDEALPDYISSAVSPVEIDSISFTDADKINDVNKVSHATKSLFNSAGGGQVLNSSDVTGTEALKAVIRSDTEFAISSLLPQIQGQVNRMLKYELSNPSDVVYYPISVYTKDWFKEDLIKESEYGVPVKLALNVLNGISEKQTLSIMHLENDILKLPDKFIPLQSSHTQSGTQKTTTPSITNEPENEDGDENEQ